MLTHSESIKNISLALLKFQSKLKGVSKDSTNPFFKSKYASLSHIQETIQDPLIHCGLVYTQNPVGENGLTTMLIHAESGEFFKSTYEMRPEKNTPQGKGSCITYQKRYTLAAILGLNTDYDDDGNAASIPAPHKKVAKKVFDIEQFNKTEKVISGYFQQGLSIQDVKSKMSKVYDSFNPESEAAILELFKNR